MMETRLTKEQETTVATTSAAARWRAVALVLVAAISACAATSRQLMDSLTAGVAYPEQNPWEKKGRKILKPFL